jgi:hypothetical protein
MKDHISRKKTISRDKEGKSIPSAHVKYARVLHRKSTSSLTPVQNNANYNRGGSVDP